MAEDLKILMAQINPVLGAVQKNTDKIIEIIETQQDTHDIILFPELVICGYPPEDLLLRPAFQKEIDEALLRIQQAVRSAHVLIGHPFNEDGRRYNTATVFHQQKVITRYFKQKLPNEGVFDEHRYFVPGDSPACIIEVKDTRCGIVICEDLWQEGPVEHAIGAGAQILLCLNASPFDDHKYERRTALLSKYAQQGLHIFYTNLIGGQDDLLFDGNSLVIGPEGICARASAFKEELLSVTFTDNTVIGSSALLLSQDALMYAAVVCAIKDYVQKNNIPGVVLGLSGGIDSALTLALAVDALGSDKVLAVMMPSQFTADMSNDDALEQIYNMGVAHTTLPIEPAFKSLLDTLRPELKIIEKDTTQENIQARIRGILLMALANNSGKMVLTTSNKSETAVGYATLYGDMAGGFAPLKDVLKTQVYALARFRNSISNVIPERVLTRAPSAELANGQTDQDNLPDYATLDAILVDYMQKQLSAEQLIAAGYPKDAVKRVLSLLKANEHKRRQSAPGPKLSPRAFGREWRYPLTSGFYESY